MIVNEFPMDDLPSTASVTSARPRDIDENSYESLGRFAENDEVLSNAAADTDFCEYYAHCIQRYDYFVLVSI